MIYSIYNPSQFRRVYQTGPTHILPKQSWYSFEEYYHFCLNGRKIAERLKRSHENIYRILRQLKKGLIAFEIHLQYQVNKENCGHKKIQLPDSEVRHINEKVQEDWMPDVIIGGKESSNWNIICNQQDIDI